MSRYENKRIQEKSVVLKNALYETLSSDDQLIKHGSFEKNDAITYKLCKAVEITDGYEKLSIETISIRFEGDRTFSPEEIPCVIYLLNKSKNCLKEMSFYSNEDAIEYLKSIFSK
jgi:hypothetical protein